MNYQEYLSSERWAVLRGIKLKQAWYKCQLCNSNKTGLHVHHRCYDRLGDEALEDLIVLCGDCHARFHDKLPVYAEQPQQQVAPEDDLFGPTNESVLF